MIRRIQPLAAALVAALVVFPVGETAGAQVRLPTQPPIRQLNGPSKQTEDSQPIPPAYRPPPGMCRIWLENVPPSQQPAPTDCVTAVRNRPSNARVIFGDDYVDKRGRDKDKRPESSAASTTSALILASGERVHGPQAGDSFESPYDSTAVVMDARPLDAPGVVASDSTQPPRRRAAPPPTGRRAQPRDTGRVTDRVWREPDLDGRRQTLSEQRRVLRDRMRDRDRDRDDDDFDDDDLDDRRGARRDGRSDPRLNGRYDPRLGYGVPYGNGYGSGYYPPPGRANGVCLDRDGDGWCDDARTGGGYCRDLDGDGRCDDYPELAAAPYSSSMPPMSAAMAVARGAGSPIALRWLGTAEVMVRTTDLKRTGTPYRAMWLDAASGRLLQVWTDRDGDGIADRVEIYRNGRVAKILGR